MHLEVEAHQEWPEAGRGDGKHPTSEPPERPHLANTLISDFQPPELRGNEYICFKPSSLR